jgi:signal transduction histidine kinase
MLNSTAIKTSIKSRIYLLATVAVAAILALFYLSIFSLGSVIRQKDEVALDYSERLLDVERLFLAAEKQVSSSRGYLLFKNQEMLLKVEEAREEFDLYRTQLEREVTTDQGRQYLSQITEVNREYQLVVDRLLKLRMQNDLQAIRDVFVDELSPKREELYQLLRDFEAYKKNLLEQVRAESVLAAQQGWRHSLIMGVMASLIIPFLAWLLYRALMQRQQAQAQVKMRQDVLASVSHDLKNPLWTILIGAGLIKQKAPDNESGRLLKQLADKIKNAGDSMNALIEDLLSLASIESGSLPIKQQVFEASTLAEEAHQMLQMLAQPKKITVNYQFLSPPALLEADYQKLLRVLSNFIGNAVKFTPEQGEIKLRVEAGQGEQLIFAVSDTGPGIAPENLQHVFNQFWQAQATAHQGSGLGLAIAKGIIDAHSGEIWVESQLGQGATFYFSVPLLRQTMT